MENNKPKNFTEYVESFTTVFTGSYKVAFEKEVARLIGLHLEIEDRKCAVEFLCDTYITETGNRPVGSQLDALASHLLYEALEGDARPDKITLEDYPVVTATMTKRRLLNRGESATDEAAFNVISSDRKVHGAPTKRSRRQYENDHVEKQAQEKARLLNAEYKRATSPSAIVTTSL
jgi:hypothetical protein